jgi:hypothetical protein
MQASPLDNVETNTNSKPRLGPAVRWVVLPVLVLVVCEVFARMATDRVPRWYGAADRIAETQHIDAMFVGSSRVQAAVPTETFVRAVAERTGRAAVVLNLGRGYSTFLEHYLGLRNLVDAHPESLAGVTVFVEAPGGLTYNDRFDQPWADPAQHQLLVDLLRLSDLPRFLQSSQDRSTRLKVSVRLLSRQVALVNRRERLRSTLVESFSGPTTVRVVGEDLQGPGPASSIRTDDEALRAARELAHQLAAQFEQSPSRAGPWRDTVLEQLRQTLQRVGGHLVFFVPPESDVFRRIHHTQWFREDAATFASQVQEWGACFLDPAFKYTDEDLPDLWHLRPDRSPAFTVRLADEWLTKCRPALTRSGSGTP